MNKLTRFQTTSDLIIGPSGKKLPVDVTPQKTGFSVNFLPSEVGEYRKMGSFYISAVPRSISLIFLKSSGPHQVSIAIDSIAIPGSPFTCNVYDVNKIKVTGLGVGYVGVPLTFQGNYHSPSNFYPLNDDAVRIDMTNILTVRLIRSGRFSSWRGHSRISSDHAKIIGPS